MNSALQPKTLAFALHFSASIPEKAEDISPLLVSETVPQAGFLDTEQLIINFKDRLAKKPSVLVFYRGGLCSYCKAHPSDLTAIDKDVASLGYQVIGVSPDDYQYLQTTQEQNNIPYQLVSDPEGNFIQEIGIAFKSSVALKEYIVAQGNKGETSPVMPVPTVH